MYVLKGAESSVVNLQENGCQVSQVSQTMWLRDMRQESQGRSWDNARRRKDTHNSNTAWSDPAPSPLKGLPASVPSLQDRVLRQVLFLLFPIERQAYGGPERLRKAPTVTHLISE